MKLLRSGLLIPLLWITAASANAAGSVTLNWLDGTPPPAQTGVSWGVPWPKGEVHTSDSLSLKTADGQPVDLQTWPMAYWPDGSIKWSGCAIAAGPKHLGPLQLSVGSGSTLVSAKIVATQDDSKIDIDNGVFKCRISKSGSTLFDSITIGNRQVARDARLIAITEDRSQLESQGIIRQERFESRIKTATLEQAGPYRAVVKIEGEHHSVTGDRAWLPFVVRFYFYAGSGSIRMVHSFVFDGDGHKDFIKGLGISIDVPFAEELHNRHVRFTGDKGMWEQPVRLLPGYRNTPDAPTYARHLAGQRMPNMAQIPENSQIPIETVPVWNDFKLTQLGPDSFGIDKRTTATSSWVHVDNGRRAPGFAVLADVSGGIAVGVKSFWEKYPSEIEINDAAQKTGRMTIWLWSPDGPAMDLRSYDTVPHGLTTNYEDWKPGWDTATGTANTADLTLWALDSVPASDMLVDMSKTATAPPLLICTPEYYHSIPVFGTWSLPDSSTPAKKWIETQLNTFISFYQQQVEERHWYGFWNFGDVMHNYDFGRHQWRYDVGGWAWMNGELMPDMFLYESFLRTGRADIFRMAEAMTRQNSEVDTYHLGPFAPLGSRHAVDHFGDGAKQPRISQSSLRRFYYYLTTDDRTGDLMREQLTADFTYAQVKKFDLGHFEPGDPLPPAQTPPAIEPNEDLRTGTSLGTDWTSYASNWMTEWERTGDTKWRDKIMAGMTSMVKNGRNGQLAGGTYDPRTGVFAPGGRGGAAGGGGRGGGGFGYFDMIFGGPEVFNEMKTMIDYPEFWTGWANACANLAATGGNNMTGPRAAAYAAFAKHDATLGMRAWDALIGDGMDRPLPEPRLIDTPDLLIPMHDPAFLGAGAGWQLHGPASVQWSLNAIETLELAKEWLPAWEKLHDPKQP